MLTMREQEKMVADAMATFPETFGLLAYSGTFRIGESQSYVNDYGVVMLYTQKLIQGEWYDFAKGSPEELRAQIVPLK
jgi:hypothetical protein